MKTITIKKTLYNFKEVREKALEKNRYINVDYDWYCFTIDDYRDKLEKIGFINSKIYFSVFYYQGDGACFDAYVDIEKLLDYLLEIKKLDEDEVKKLKNLQDFYDIKIKKNQLANRYNHENTRYIIIENYFSNELVEDKTLLEKLENIVEKLRLDLCIDIYKDLESEYNYLTSDETLSQQLEDDFYWFNEDGTIYDL